MYSAHELSSEPIRIQVASSDYSEQDQRMSGSINKELTITYNGTRTYDYQGRPNDADSD